eukprot:g2801.t1
MDDPVTQFAVQQLRSLLGFDEVDEIAQYVVTLQDDAISSYMTDMLGDPARADAFAKALRAKRKAHQKRTKSAAATTKQAESKLLSSAEQAKKGDAERASSARNVMPAKMSQKERKRWQREQQRQRYGEIGADGFPISADASGIEADAADAPPEQLGPAAYVKGELGAFVQVRGKKSSDGIGAGGGGGGSTQRAAPRSGKSVQVTRVSKAPGPATTKKIGLGLSGSRTATGAADVAGADKPYCNCLYCGRIAYVDEGKAEKCEFCGLELEWDADKRANLGRRLATEGVEGCNKEALAAMARAEGLRDKLLHFDRTSAQRSYVYDDQADYYGDSASAWLSSEERSAAREKADARREKNLYRKRQVKISFDIAGRRVIEQSDDEDEDRDAADGVPEWDDGSALEEAKTALAPWRAAAAESDALQAGRGSSKLSSTTTGRFGISSSLFEGPLAQYSSLPAEDASSAPETLAGAGLTVESGQGVRKGRALANSALTGRAKEVFDAIAAGINSDGAVGQRTLSGGTSTKAHVRQRLQHAAPVCEEAEGEEVREED